MNTNNMTPSLGTPTAPRKAPPAKPERAAPAPKPEKPKAEKAAPKPAKKASNGTGKPAARKAASKPAKPARKAAAPTGKAKAPSAPRKATQKATGAARKAAPSKAKPKAPAKPRAAQERAYTIDKDRPTQHGKTRPSANTVGGKLWAEFESFVKRHHGKLVDKHLEKMPTLEEALEIGKKLKLNATSTTLAYYRWRKFWGVRGRQ
jgi:hypothetical protein